MTVICSYCICPVLTYTDFDPFASIVVLVSISNKAGVDLHYPCVLEGNQVFSTNYMELVDHQFFKVVCGNLILLMQ